MPNDMMDMEGGGMENMLRKLGGASKKPHRGGGGLLEIDIEERHDDVDSEEMALESASEDLIEGVKKNSAKEVAAAFRVMFECLMEVRDEEDLEEDEHDKEHAEEDLEEDDPSY